MNEITGSKTQRPLGLLLPSHGVVWGHLMPAEQAVVQVLSAWWRLFTNSTAVPRVPAWDFNHEGLARSHQNDGSSPQSPGRAVAAGGEVLPGGGTALTCQVTALGEPSVVPGLQSQMQSTTSILDCSSCSEHELFAASVHIPVLFTQCSHTR